MSKAVIYTKPSCPYCKRAKSVFVRENIEYEEIVYDGEKITKEYIAEAVGKPAEEVTFPQIYLDGTYVGGFTELWAKYKK